MSSNPQTPNNNVTIIQVLMHNHIPLILCLLNQLLWYLPLFYK